MRNYLTPTLAITGTAAILAIGFALPTPTPTESYAAATTATGRTLTTHNQTTRRAVVSHPKPASAPEWSAMLPTSMRRPCNSEGDVNCYWNASTSGNNVGHSYIVREVPGKSHMVCVFYVNKSDAKKWDYCD